MSRHKILVVDDDPDLLASVVRVLKAAGYKVSAAQGGHAAIEELTTSSPDLVLCDVVMPGFNGFQTTRKLKSIEATSECPVLLMSGKTDPADAYWAKEVGAIALLRKPLDTRALIEQIEDVLSQSQTQSNASPDEEL